MRLRPLTRLRLAFVGLGAVLLTPLGFLLNAVDERVEAQRRLRHDVVAERIFDELERELTSVLEGESGRPSAAYDEPTRSDTWGPYVIGYFKIDAAGLRLLAPEQLGAERTRRMTETLAALAASTPEARHPKPELLDSKTEMFDSTLGSVEMGIGEDVEATAGRKQAFSPRSSPDVLQKLNRSQEVRKRSKPVFEESKSKRVDPLQGL